MAHGSDRATVVGQDLGPARGAVRAALQGATKVFGGTVALADVSLELRRGEVLALLGENGAGKSTCVKLLAGVYRPDRGQVLLDERPVELGSPLEAQRHGIAVMHQHPGLFADLSVAENVFIGHLRRGPAGGLDDALMRREAQRLLEAVGLACAPEAPLRSLRSSEQQLVEIARALSFDAGVLIMDEPTAALSLREVDRLFGVVDGLRSRGVAMMFVSHRMEEIYRVADRVAVLRDGRLVAVETAAAMSPDRAVQLMVGRPLSDMYPALDASPGETVLEVDGLSRAGAFAEISFAVRAGEVVGLAGLVGSGRTEIARVLFGIDRLTTGKIRLNGRPIAFRSAADAMAAGVAYVSEDRIGQSLVMDFGVLNNASLTVIGRAIRAGLVSARRELALVQSHLERLRLRFRSYDQPVRTLSGGNQQKVVLSKWLATNPRLLILDEPTQGVDVQTKAEVHAMIASLARQGMAIILISSELPEIIGMSSRILVLHEGRMTAEFAGREATQERILFAATDAALSAKVTTPAPAVPGGAAAGPAASGRAPAAAPAAEGKTTAGVGRTLRRVVARREMGLVIAILAVVLPVIAVNPRMLGGSNLLALSMDAALLAIVATGQMLVLLTRNIDLSVASVIGLAAYGSASLMHSSPELGIAAGLAVASAIGLACGVLNGLVVTVGQVPAIVVTLGTLSLYRGVNSLWAGGRQISADQVPQAWLDLTSRKLAGIPGVVIIAVATLVILAFVLRRRAVGRELYAIGSNPEGAKLIGIRVQRRVLGAFACAGMLAGFDGGLWASRYATIDARVALGFELTVIAAVVVGGVAIRGGAGTVTGVALGALTLLVIRNGLTLVRVDPLWLQGVYGLVILVAIGIDALVVRRAERAAAVAAQGRR
jgi:ABC-type sugar transport system ATPase subunit/ribose/xylose/arabinose/galactoside ABC-type transport system permease subunit